MSFNSFSGVPFVIVGTKLDLRRDYENLIAEGDQVIAPVNQIRFAQDPVILFTSHQILTDIESNFRE